MTVQQVRITQGAIGVCEGRIELEWTLGDICLTLSVCLDLFGNEVGGNTDKEQIEKQDKMTVTEKTYCAGALSLFFLLDWCPFAYSLAVLCRLHRRA